jgi:parvulin-like peptidyl-prolyl isomerase
MLTLCLSSGDILPALNQAKKDSEKMVKIAKKTLAALVLTGVSVIASDILVTVNGHDITKKDAEALVRATSPNTTYEQLPPQQKEMIKKALIEKVLLAEVAQKEGIDKTPEFKRNMEKIRNELMVNMWMKKQLDNTIVSDSEAKAFYDKNKDKFMQPAKVHARHILVKTEKEAKSIIDELKNLNGEKLKEKFIELAKKKSVGPSGPQGGDLGEFTKGQMVPEFSKAVWSLKPGEITTKPVKTQFGYHVIYLESKKEAQPVAYEQIKDRIINTLKQKQFAQKISDMTKELRAKATIVDPSKKAADNK